MGTTQRKRGLGPPQRPATWTATGFITKRLQRPVQKQMDCGQSIVAVLQRYEEQLANHHTSLRLEAVERLSSFFKTLAQRGTSTHSIPFNWLKLFDRVVMLSTEPYRAQLRKRACALLLQMLNDSSSDLDLASVLRPTVLRIAGATASSDIDCRVESFQLLRSIVTASRASWRLAWLEALGEETVISTLMQAWIHWAGGDPTALTSDAPRLDLSLRLQHRPYLQQTMQMEAALDALEMLLDVTENGCARYFSKATITCSAQSLQKHLEPTVSAGEIVHREHNQNAERTNDASEPVEVQAHPLETPSILLLQIPSVTSTTKLPLPGPIRETSRGNTGEIARLACSFCREAIRILTGFVLEHQVADERLYKLLRKCVQCGHAVATGTSAMAASTIQAQPAFLQLVQRIWERHLQPHWACEQHTPEADRAFCALTICVAEALSRPDLISEEMVPAAVQEGAAWQVLAMCRFPLLVQGAWRREWLQRCLAFAERGTASAVEIRSSDLQMLERYGDQDCLTAGVKLAYRFLLSARAVDRGRMEQSMAAACLRAVRHALLDQRSSATPSTDWRPFALVMAPFFAVPSRGAVILRELAPCLLMEVEALVHRLLIFSQGRVPLRLERAMAACQQDEKVILEGRWRSVLCLSRYMTVETRCHLLFALLRGLSQLSTSLEPRRCFDFSQEPVAFHNIHEENEIHTLVGREWKALSCAFPWVHYALHQLMEQEVSLGRLKPTLASFLLASEARCN